MSKNIILTASDESYFNSFIALLASLNETNFHKLVLLDVGLSKNNKEVIKKLENVILINFDKEFSELDQEIGFDYFKNNKTYGFKPYLLKNFYKKINIDENNSYNILYIDSGIKANKSLDDIFEIIDEEEIFCIDHSSEMDYGNIEKRKGLSVNYGGCMLLNILPPPIYEKIKELHPIDFKGLTDQYIKAGFFGYKFKGKYTKIIDYNLELFKSTLIGVFDEKVDKEYYKNLLTEFLTNKSNYFSLNYLSNRHDQTILSYLINAYKIKQHSSDKYMTTIYQKTHFIKYIYFQALFLLKRKEEIEDLIEIEYDNTYNLSKMNISENLKLYFSQQYIKINFKEYDSDIYYFSEKDLLYKKYEDILKLYNIKNDDFTKKLYYNLMIKWSQEKEKSHKKILLKSDKTYLILHRNNEIKNFGTLINMIEKQKIFLMGNGPSLKEIMNNPEYLEFLKNNKTFGLNAAYRAYEKYNFYPTFFGCFDSKVCKYHSKEFEKLILNSPIEKFFFINIGPDGEKIFTEPNIINHHKFVDINFIFRKPEEKKLNNILSYDYSYFVDMMTSGTNAVQCCLIEGYKEIYLLGCDCNYVEIVQGATLEKNTLKMTETPEKNPNYWMDDYQQKGDVFNLPNVQGCQLPAWKRLNDTLNNLKIKVKIFNCSNISKIEYFEKKEFSHLYLENTDDR